MMQDHPRREPRLDASFDEITRLCNAVIESLVNLTFEKIGAFLSS
jgi:hypothetical protein